MKKSILIIILYSSYLTLYSQTKIDISRTQLENAKGNIVNLPQSITEKDAVWEQKDASYQWNINVSLTGDYYVVPLFEKLVLPANSSIMAYTSDKSYYSKTYTKNPNENTQSFVIPEMYSNSIVIVITINDKSQLKDLILEISQIGGIPSSFGNSSEETQKIGFGASIPCLINVKCPVGDPYSNQIRATVKYMSVGSQGIGFCTGVLVNNTKEDNTPYLLTAQHCGITSSESQFGQYVFYFNYQSPNCENPKSDKDIKINEQTVIGATMLASSGTTFNLAPSGSDFMLLKLNPIPAEYNVYLAGWNRSEVELQDLASDGTIIHHPRADIKKISFWKGLETGITVTHRSFTMIADPTYGKSGIEPMSSGSPIFDKNKLLIGNSTAGESNCVTTTEDQTVGGLVYQHWDQNGSSPELQLKPWLDPLNSNVKQLNGKNIDNNLSPKLAISNIKEQITITPNPFQNNIEVSSKLTILNLFIYNQSGEMLIESKQLKINTTLLPKGIYILKIVTNSGNVITKIIKS